MKKTYIENIYVDVHIHTNVLNDQWCIGRILICTFIFLGLDIQNCLWLMFIFKVSQPNLRTAGPNHTINSAPLNTYIESISHTIHVWYIYLHEWLISMVNI